MMSKHKKGFLSKEGASSEVQVKEQRTAQATRNRMTLMGGEMGRGQSAKVGRTRCSAVTVGLYRAGVGKFNYCL